MDGVTGVIKSGDGAGLAGGVLVEEGTISQGGAPIDVPNSHWLVD